MHASSIIWVVTYEANWFVNVVIVVLRERLTEEVLQKNKERKLHKNL